MKQTKKGSAGVITFAIGLIATMLAISFISKVVPVRCYNPPYKVTGTELTRWGLYVESESINDSTCKNNFIENNFVGDSLIIYQIGDTIPPADNL